MVQRVRDQDGEQRLHCCHLHVFLPHGRADMVRHLRLAHGIPTALARKYVAAVLQPKKRRTWWGEQYELFAPGEAEVREPPASVAVLGEEE